MEKQCKLFLFVIFNIYDKLMQFFPVKRFFHSIGKRIINGIQNLDISINQISESDISRSFQHQGGSTQS